MHLIPDGYDAPPFHKLGVYQKMRAIPDAGYYIEYPEHATRFESKILDHMTRRVPTVVIETIKRCLDRVPKARATFPDLLENEWLGMKEAEVPSPLDQKPYRSPRSVRMRQSSRNCS